MKQISITTIAAVLLVGCGKAEIGSTLIAAIAGGDIEAVKQHLAAGVDVNVKTEDGLTPLDRAIKYQRTETAVLLRKHGGKTGEELK